MLAFATIAFVTGPGIVKARRVSLVAARRTLLVRSSSAGWRELFDRADVVSEGRIRDEAEGRVWYGTTSLILPIPVLEGGNVILLACLAERDVHLRLRALRMAHREASLRAPSRLGRLVCEIHITGGDLGVRIDVDVQAPLIDSERSRVGRGH